MSAAACAKIIIDNYAALGGSAQGLWVTGEASCEALMTLIEAHPEMEERALALSALACKWGDEMAAWKKHIENEVRAMAEEAMADTDTGKPTKREPAL